MSCCVELRKCDWLCGEEFKCKWSVSQFEPDIVAVLKIDGLCGVCHIEHDGGGTDIRIFVAVSVASTVKCERKAVI